MINSTCKKQDYIPVTDLGNGVRIIRWGKAPVVEQVYEDVTDENGKVTDRRPTGETRDTGMVVYTEEIFHTKPSAQELAFTFINAGRQAMGEEIKTACAGLELTDEDTLLALRLTLSAYINRHDTSTSVNSFTLMGKEMWLPKETRVGLVNSINIEKAAGKTATVLWFGGVRYELPIDTALQMLAALELYALDCYNVTQSHLAAIDTAQTVDELTAYDYTEGYPEHPAFGLDSKD